MTLTPNSKIYFIGIGGVAMSATAGIAKQLGYIVSGSDSKNLYDPAKSVLDDLNIPYFVGYDATQIKESGADIFIASAGEDEQNPEIAYLLSQNTELYSLSQLLYELSIDKLRVVVTGTHGKSTTTTMLGKVLQNIDDSSFMTGAVLIGEDRNFYVGDGHYFVFEGDEYKALYDDPTPKFQQYKADIALLTNLEFDHPDIYSSVTEISDELTEMLEKMPDDGLVVYNSDSPELNKLMHKINLGNISFGIEHPADFIAKNIITNEDYTNFEVVHGNEKTENYRIPAFGKINVYNALGVIALLRTLGFSAEQIQEGLLDYPGIKRRFEFIGENNGAKIFDDYAHHPTAIKETIQTAKVRFPSKKIWVVFEPHTFSRTQAVLPDLARAFDEANEVLISEIYSAREQSKDHSISGEIVVNEIKQTQPHVRLVKDKLEALKILQEKLTSEDVVIIMAVGSFNTLARDLAQN